MVHWLDKLDSQGVLCGMRPALCMQVPPCTVTCPGACEQGVERPRARADDEEEQCAEEHGPVSAGLVCHLPDSIFKQYRHLRGCDCHKHIHEERDGGESRQQSQEQEQSADDLYSADKWG